MFVFKLFTGGSFIILCIGLIWCIAKGIIYYIKDRDRSGGLSFSAIIITMLIVLALIGYGMMIATL